MRTFYRSLACILGVLALVGCGNEADKGKAKTPTETACDDGADNDKDGQSDCNDLDCRLAGGSCKLAPALDRTVATTLVEASRFLYTGPDPLQKGVKEKAIDPRRAAMVRGRVVDVDGEPLAGVKVSVADSPELGHTETRGDGFFDMAVNGGARLVMKYELDGYVPAQRVSQPGWQRYGQLPEVGLIEESGKETTLQAETNAVQVALANETNDAFGRRQLLVLMQPDTDATAELPDGSEEDLSTLTLRVTEYPFEPAPPGTWQQTARFAPGTLPGSNALHYGIELRVAEAEKREARWVTFSKPVSLYVENFLNLPVGSPVPLGYYDRKLGQWQAAEGGTVIEILSTDGGRAAIDADGDGAAETEDALDDLRVTNAELDELAKRYEPGTRLWRAMVHHFSPWDVLFPTSAPPGSVAPNVAQVFSRTLESPARRGLVQVETQALSQSVPIVGTSLALTYQSDRTESYQAAFEMELPLVPARVPPGLKKVFSIVRVAGKELKKDFDPEPELIQVVDWDGEDAFGRKLQGPQTAEITVGYVFDSIISIGRTFGSKGTSTAIPAAEAGLDVPGFVLTQKFETTVGVWDAAGYELGGFGIDALHGYDPAHQKLFFGSGTVRDGKNVALIVKDLAQGNDLGTPDGVAVAPDGSIFITDDQQDNLDAGGRILRIDTEGEVTVVAGPGAEGDAGNLDIFGPQGIAVTADGSVVFADFGDDTVKRLSPDGSLDVLVGPATLDPIVTENLTNVDGIALGPSEEIFIVDENRVLRFEGNALTLFAGGGTGGDDGPATDAELIVPSGIAVAPDGSVFIAERGLEDGTKGHRVRKVLPDGTITTVAGTGVAGFSGDGLLAVEAQLDNPRGLALAADGSLYIADQFNDRIRRVTPDGIIQTVVGGGDTAENEGQVATEVTLDFPDGIAIGADGKLFVPNSATVLQVAPGLPELSDRDNLIPSPDGRTLFRFDERGKHQETIDAMTAVVEQTFVYDDDGRLVELRDKNGQVVTFERRSNGDLRAIVAPFGQRTTIDLDDQDRLVTTTDPLSRTFQFSYDGDAGPLTTAIDPKGGTFTFEYDELGLLTTITDPTLYSETLSRGKVDRGYAVTVTTPSGRETEYRVEPLPGERLDRTVTRPDDTKSESSDDIKERTMRSPDGSVVTQTLTPDPFFGSQAPFAETTVTQTPGGRSLTKSFIREKLPEGLDNALEVEEWFETSSVNDLQTVTSFNRADRVITSVSPFGRTVFTTLDELGRKIAVEQAGMPTQRYVYDDAGRVIESSLEADGEVRTTTYEYGDDGFLRAITNPNGDTTTNVHDRAGRITETVRPDGESVLRQLDENDNVLTLTAPGGGVHTARYQGASNQLIATLPPEIEGVASPTPDFGLGEAQFSYTADNELEQTIRSDGRKIVNTYNTENGRLDRVDLDGVRITYGYDAFGTLTSINRSDSVRVTSTFDGPLLTGTAWTGAVEGSVTATYDENFRIDTMTVNGSSSARFTYDEDSLVTSATANGVTLSLARDNATGRIDGTTLDSVSTSNSYNGFSELSVLSADFDGADLFRQDIERDALGRVTSISERVGATTREISYSYDELGRLVEARRDGATATYTYDLNGNRLNVDRDGEELSGTYDAQDRLVAFGDQTIEQTAQGDLLRVVQDDSAIELSYDELGNLMTATSTAADGTTDVEYKVDGLGRRVAKRVNGAFDKAWFYRDALRPVAQIDAAGIFMHFIYGTDGSAPDFILRAGTPLRVIKDHHGSVRLVVNALTGVIEQELDYDEFGRVLTDTNPGFQPFGFVGGLFDSDTGLVRFGKRDYSARFGRWLAKDQLGFGGGDTNLYGYCGNDPVNCTDPSGEIAPVAWVAYLGIALIFASISGDTYVEGSGSPELFHAGMFLAGSGFFYTTSRGYWALEEAGSISELGPTFGNLGDDAAGTVLGTLSKGKQGWQIGDDLAEGTYDFVVQEGKIIVGKSHPALAGGARVTYAGDATFRGGQLVEWTNVSGHFRPAAAFASNAGLPMNVFRAARFPASVGGIQLPVF